MFGLEHQRMPALRAHVFVAAVAIGELFVIVLAEKARQRMTHARERPVFGEIRGSTPALPAVVRGLFEDVVVDAMPPQET